jgi:putative acetyltransferase
MKIRDFQPADAAAFRALNEEWLRAYFELEPKDMKVLGDPRGEILASGGTILMLESDGQVVGCCALVPHGEGVLELAKMAVTAKWRGKGLGEELLKAAIERARGMGARRLYLESNSKLGAALGLYRKVGFADVPATGTEYARVDVFMGMEL